jgi:hypothetical protein
LNALVDESRTAGDTDILGSLVPRLLVPTTLADETAYIHTYLNLGDLAKPIWQGDAFAKEKLQQINQDQGKKAERSPWESYSGWTLAYAYLRELILASPIHSFISSTKLLSHNSVRNIDVDP